MSKFQGDQKFNPEESAALLASVVRTQLEDCRGTVIFKLACNWSPLSQAERPSTTCEWRIEEIVSLEAARRIRAIPPGIFRVLPLDTDELLIVAHGLVDGTAVLGAAARLVQCYDEVLRGADSPWCPDVAIGIALPQKSGGTIGSLLAAANSALRDSMQAVCTSLTTRHSVGGESV
jgi:hypothetical protein